MSLSLRPEDIFDSAVDDDLFEQLSGKLAGALGARSGVLHWRRADDIREQEISYSGYFSDADMAKFEDDFEKNDLWATALGRPAALNRVWCLEELVPRKVYENSRIYNEWIRQIGDDTMHALGAVIHAPEMRIDLGFHRGRSQQPFTSDQVELLASYLPAIRAMLRVRQRMLALRGDAAATALNVMGDALFTLSPQGCVVHLNATAEAMLQRGDVVSVRNGRLRAIDAGEDARLSAAIARTAGALSVTDALRLTGRSGRVHSATLASAPVGAPRRLVLLVSDQTVRDPTVEQRLTALYGLSQTEAEIAALLAEGLSPADVAEQRRTSLGTTRSQLKSIAAKLGVGRQSEIVRAVLLLPRLAR